MTAENRRAALLAACVLWASGEWNVAEDVLPLAERFAEWLDRVEEQDSAPAVGSILTARDPEPPVGTAVRDIFNATWFHVAQGYWDDTYGGRRSWVRLSSSSPLRVVEWAPNGGDS